MLRRALIATAFALPASAGFAQTGLLNVLGGSGAANFIDAAAMSDLFEIESSRILLIGSRHPQIREFAERMVVHHTVSTNELRIIPEAADRNPPALDQRHVSLLNLLRAAEGDLLDRTYVDQQIDAHEEAIVLYRTFANAEQQVTPLRAFARKQLPLLEQHLVLAKALQAPRAG
jgi:putative membrane protein